MPLTIHAACATNTGRIRSNNEDNFFFHGQYLPELHGSSSEILRFSFPQTEAHWLAVLDGMGGENYGELASFAAAETLSRLKTERAAFPSVADYATEVAQELNLAVVEQMDIMKTSHMGTTLAALYFADGAAVSCNLGDSRVYRLQNGMLWQLSEDHVSTRPMPAGRKAPLTQNLGVDPEELLLEPTINESRIRNGDRFLICSDGVTDMLEDARIAALLQAAADPAEAVSALIDAALEAGGRDNITAIVCIAEEDGEEFAPGYSERNEDITVQELKTAPTPKPQKPAPVTENRTEQPSPAEKKRPGLIWLLPLLALAALSFVFLRKSRAPEPPMPTATVQPEATLPPTPQPTPQPAPKPTATPEPTAQPTPENQVTIRTEDGEELTLIEETEVDTLGKIISLSRLDGTLYSRKEYDPDGNIRKELSCRSDGSPERENEFRADGSKLKETTYVADGSKTETYFNAAGQEVRGAQFNADGSKIGWDETEYDDAGNRVKWTMYTPDGCRTEHSYDAQGNKIAVRRYDAQGKEIDE